MIDPRAFLFLAIKYIYKDSRVDDEENVIANVGRGRKGLPNDIIIQGIGRFVIVLGEWVSLIIFVLK